LNGKRDGRARQAGRARPVLVSDAWLEAGIGDRSAAERSLEQGGGLENLADDLTLIRSIARKDREAFETLYYRYAPRLGRYAMRLLRRREAVDEAINDVMLAVWQDAGRFDPHLASLSAWLFGITHHKVLKLLARTPSQPHVDANEAELADSGEQPERVAMGKQLGVALADALEKLSPDQRAVIELAFGEGQSYQEIAAAMGCPINTVKTRVFHARRRLASILAEERDDLLEGQS
jgi:RNA polymerase sigma-70 factor (ECF subfamily)